VALLLLAFYRGIRVPNAWTLNYYQASWADGFFRRGLLGTLLLPLGCARFDPALVHAIQWTVLAVVVALLVWLGRRGAAAFFVCLFLVSDAGTFLFNEVGYLDPLMLVLGLACGAFIVRGRTGTAALLLALTVLVHEMAVFTVLPAALVFRLRMAPGTRPSLVRLLTPLALALAALFVCSKPVSQATLTRFSERASACGWPLARPDFEQDYLGTFGQAFRVHYRAEELGFLVLPFAFALAWWILAGQALGTARRPEQWATLAASLSPFLLGLLGWDCGRWYFLAVLQVLLLLGTAKPTDAKGQGRLPFASRLLRAAPLIAVVGLTPIPRFDDSSARGLSAPDFAGFRAVFVARPVPATVQGGGR
jgi:hypothetical protein